MLLRGRRKAHWLFAAFSTCVAAWYVSQSLADLVQDETKIIFERLTGVLTVLLPQFAVNLFQSITPLETNEKNQPSSRLPKIAAALGVPMLVIVALPYHRASATVRAFVLGGVYSYVFGLLAAALLFLWR